MDDKTAEEWKNIGNEQYKTGDYRQAIESYTKAIDASPTTSSYYGNRAAANFMVLKYDEVIKDCNKAIVMEPTYIKAYIRKAKALLELGDMNKALDTYRNALIRDPNDSSLLNEKRKVELAIERLKRGKEHLDNGRIYESLSCFNSVLETVPGCITAKIGQAKAYIEKEQYDEAFASLTKLMRSNNNPEILYLRARCLYFQCEFSNAVKHLQQALRSDPDNKLYMIEIKKIRSLESQKEEANQHFKTGKIQEAIDGYTNCITIDPKNKIFNAKLYNNRATALSKLGKHAEAIKDCDKSIYNDESFVKAYLRKAECLKILGGEDNLEQVLREYEKAGKLVGQEGQRDIQYNIRETKLALKKAKRKDYYKILEITQKATDAEIKKSYRKLALRWHPDRHSSKNEEEQKVAEATFKNIGEAYAVLSDPKKRQRYDSGVDIEDLDNEYASAQGGGMHGVDPTQIFEMFFGGGGRGMGGMAGMGGMGGMGGGFSHQRYG